MNNKQLEEYEEWRDDVITIACADFGWAWNAIEPIVSSHGLQCHFEAGQSPYEAVRAYMKNENF